jgi:hypothetical protein
MVFSRQVTPIAHFKFYPLIENALVHIGTHRGPSLSCPTNSIPCFIDMMVAPSQRPNQRRMRFVSGFVADAQCPWLDPFWKSHVSRLGVRLTRLLTSLWAKIVQAHAQSPEAINHQAHVQYKKRGTFSA